MTRRVVSILWFGVAVAVALAWLANPWREARVSIDQRFLPGVLERRLYVAERGEVKVYDIDEGHAYRGRVELRSTDKFKGIAASTALGALYLTSREDDEVICLDLASHEVRWRRRFGKYADSLAITKDGRILWVPCRNDRPWRWYVVDAADGTVIDTVELPRTPKDPRYRASRRSGWDGPSWTTAVGPHNTVCSPDGARMYLSGFTSPYVFIADVATRELIGRVGPFDAGVRPFAVSSDEQFLFACVDGLLGFEVGAARDGEAWGGSALHRIVAQPGLRRSKVIGDVEDSAHNNPSHGIAVRPDAPEVWVVDGIYGYLHVYDASDMPPRFRKSIRLFDSADDRPEPGWITFSIDGRFAYPSTGHVVDTATREIVGRIQPSERILEIDYRDGSPVAASHR